MFASTRVFRRLPWTVLVAAASLFFQQLLCADAAPGSATHRQRPLSQSSGVLDLPASYVGELPCADCAGQRLVLTLFPDHSYRLRRSYLGVNAGADASFHELGRWQLREDGVHRLVLDAGGGQQSQYLLLSAEHLRLLDRQGREIHSALNYDLQRQAEMDAVRGPMQLRGLYAYMADAATFNECRTGKRYPVSLEAAHLDVERAYLALTRDNPGVPLLAILNGRFEERVSDPTVGPREHLIVERFDGFRPRETCARDALSRASLRNTYWTPVELEGEPVVIAGGQREPYFVLRTEGGQVHGSTGCNRITAGYQQEAGDLRFSDLAATDMVCPTEAMQLEARFLGALKAVATWRIIAESLELRDTAGQLRMRLESRYLR